jgi:hypothetical protein
MPGGLKFTLRRFGLSSRNSIFGVISFVFLFTLFHFHPISSSYLYGSNEPLPVWPAPAQTHLTHTEDIHWPQCGEEVKQAFLHAYHGWEKYAAPKDDLLPLLDRGIDEYIC